MQLPVSNSSPLIHLSRLAKLGYLRKAYPSLYIPTSVRIEIIVRGKEEGYRDALSLERLEEEGWLISLRLSKRSSELARELSDSIGQGEAEAIALAEERSERLLIDDEKGRQIAYSYGLETTTTLGVILELLVKGLLSKEDYRRNVKNYSAHGWIGPDVVAEFLERGERLD